MIVKGLAHTALNVADMEKSIAFYCDVLGFRKAFEMADPQTGKPWIVYLYAGGVSDINAIADKITGAGLELDRPVKFGIDNNWQCWVRDPDRNRIELMQVGEDSPQVKFLKGLQGE